MGLFTKRRSAPLPAPDLVTWEPVDGIVHEVPGFAMDDGGCAGEQAFSVWYFTAAKPGAMITLAFYAVHGAVEGVFDTGFRYDYQICSTSSGRQSWGYAGYGALPGEWPSLETATGAARLEAARLAERGWPICPDLTGVFTWDGRPW